MRKFELVPHPNRSGENDNRYCFVVDGKTYINSTAYKSSDNEVPVRYYSFQSEDVAVTDAILECTPQEVFDTMYISLQEKDAWHGLTMCTTISDDSDFNDDLVDWVPNGNLAVSVRLSHTADISLAFSLLEFSSAVERIVKRRDAADFTFSFFSFEENGLSVGKSLMPTEETLAAMTEPVFVECKVILEQAFAEIERNASRGEILASFEFPEGLQTACEQYLMYFSQFLRDLGIRASSKISEDAGQVMFSVSPTDGDEALTRIREALDLYLTLPSSPIIKSEDSFAADRLEYQVEALKFQIKQREAELRMAHREIEHQDVLLLEAKQVILRSHSHPVQPFENHPMLPGKIEKKKAFGLTKIKKAEDWGVEIDLGEIFRRIRGTDDSDI